MWFARLVLVALISLSVLSSEASAFSRVMEMSYEDFDENKIPRYDGPGDFISLAFYSNWDLRVSKPCSNTFWRQPKDKGFLSFFCLFAFPPTRMDTVI